MAKGTPDIVEQKNYAVGEQRERNTLGWSASGVKKLRSCIVRSFVEAESGARVVQRAQLHQRAHRISEAGLSQRTGSDCAPIRRYV